MNKLTNRLNAAKTGNLVVYFDYYSSMWRAGVVLASQLRMGFYIIFDLEAEKIISISISVDMFQINEATCEFDFEIFSRTPPL